MKNEVANKLNQQLREVKMKNDAEIVHIKKMHKAEVKSWKKELGDERREKVKLEKKLEEVNLMQNEVAEEMSEIVAFDKCVDTNDLFSKNSPKPEDF